LYCKENLFLKDDTCKTGEGTDHLKVVVKLSNFHKIGKYGKELGEKSENYKT